MVAPVLVAIVLSAFLFLPLLPSDAAAASVQSSFTASAPGGAVDGSSVLPSVSDGAGRLSSDGVLVVDDVAAETLEPQIDSAALADPMTLFLLGGMTLVIIALVRRLRDHPAPVPVEVRVRTRR
jgi:hypothetical protein